LALKREGSTDNEFPLDYSLDKKSRLRLSGIEYLPMKASLINDEFNLNEELLSPIRKKFQVKHSE